MFPRIRGSSLFKYMGRQRSSGKAKRTASRQGRQVFRNGYQQVKHSMWKKITSGANLPKASEAKKTKTPNFRRFFSRAVGSMRFGPFKYKAFRLSSQSLNETEKERKESAS